ncbi:hypothetical protein [uncultured Roseobacter sp.]|uniref:hypothetical protein n=1 Tax=uncultured Roseobacter sp. TaxID=114847 RepID=UPI00263890D5|nr:hypothetical protein [uncultured Roseobacter sp.]
MTNSAQSTLLLSDVLYRLSVHIDKLAGQVFEVESTIGKFISSEAPTDATTILDLQSLDFLRQSFEDLSMLNLLLSQKTEFAVDFSSPEVIAKKLKLQATKVLIVGDEDGGCRKDQARPDDIDFF